MSKYAVISNLESPKPVHDLHNFPLHVTLIGIFNSDKQPEYFEPIIRKVSQNHSVIHTVATGRQNFGTEEKPTMVTELQNTEQLRSLHQDLITALSSDITDMNSHFLPSSYRPHVTDQNERVVSFNEEIVLNNLTFVQIQDNKVYEKFKFDLA